MAAKSLLWLLEELVAGGAGCPYCCVRQSLKLYSGNGNNMFACGYEITNITIDTLFFPPSLKVYHSPIITHTHSIQTVSTIIEYIILTAISSMNTLIRGMFCWMKGLRAVIKRSFALNSTRLAMFWTAFATSFSVRSAFGLGGSEERIIFQCGCYERERKKR